MSKRELCHWKEIEVCTSGFEGRGVGFPLYLSGGVHSC